MYYSCIIEDEVIHIKHNNHIQFLQIFWDNISRLWPATGQGIHLLRIFGSSIEIHNPGVLGFWGFGVLGFWCR